MTKHSTSATNTIPSKINKDLTDILRRGCILALHAYIQALQTRQPKILPPITTIKIITLINFIINGVRSEVLPEF